MDFKDKKYKILLTGGGTGGSVMPLLAVAEEIKAPYPNLSPIPNVMGERGENSSLSHEERMPASPAKRGEGEGQGGGYEFLWLGTKYGPEKEMVERAGIKFKAICGGKWRRYFSFKNLLDVLKIKIGFWQAFFIMLKWRPDLVMSAGSFVSVPVVWAAWILRVPVLIHQQDARPGLANKLMAPFARVVTVTFEKSLTDYGKKAVWTGNPVRSKKLEVRSKKYNFFGLSDNFPIVLIVGGGTGAMAINELVAESLGELTKFCQVIHVTGKDRSKKLEVRSKNYLNFEFLDAEQMAEAMKLADVVVSRAGMGVLSELSYLGKPTIIIPMPESHQAENAAMFKDAAVVLEQKDLTAVKLANEIKNLIGDEARRNRLGENMGRALKRGANEEIAFKIKNILLKKYYTQAENFVFDSFSKINRSWETKHFIRTVYWLKKIKPDADEAMLVAAIAHDIERAFRGQDLEKIRSSLGFTDISYYRPHEERGAEIISNFLKKQGAPDDFIERVRVLVARHEEGGDPDQTLLKDADNVSFFENNASQFLIKELPTSTKEKIKEKFDWMFNRITSDEAKKVAQPFYKKVLKDLLCLKD